MPNLTKRFRTRFAAPTKGEVPEEGLKPNKDLPPAKFKKGDYIQVYRITEKGHNDYLGNIGRVDDRYWDPKKQQWTYTAYTVGKNMAINPIEKECRAYKLPKAAASPQPAVSSDKVFPAPTWLSHQEAEEWKQVFSSVFTTPVSPSLIADPMAQLGVFVVHRGQQ